MWIDYIFSLLFLRIEIFLLSSLTLFGSTPVVSLQIAFSAGTRVGEVPEDPGLNVTVALSVTFLPHVDGGLVKPAVDRPVLGSLPVTKSYGEATEVSVDDLNTVIRRTGDVENVGTAGYHLSLHAQTSTRVVNHNI